MNQRVTFTPKTDHDAHGFVAVSDVWFVTAFEVAIGDTISEALERFSNELRATLNAHESGTNLGAEECLTLVSKLQYRMSVAAEWAARVEDLNDNRGRDTLVQEAAE